MTSTFDLLRAVVKGTFSPSARQWIRRHGGDSAESALQRILVPEMEFKNREGYENFHFTLLSVQSRKGTTALMRVKNEQSKIYFSLVSILDVFDEIVLVDNGSSDRTLEIVRSVKEEMDREDKIRIFSYPFRVARCGPEHFQTPDDSVHSLAYYYNWSLSKSAFRHVCKWDGDMVLQNASKPRLKMFLKRELGTKRTIWMIDGQTIYRDMENTLWLARDEVYREPRIFPYGYNPRFRKVELFEMLFASPPLPTHKIDGVLFYELKFTDENEFSHWSISEIPAKRKRLEMENFALVKAGKIDVSKFERLPVNFLAGQLQQSRAEEVVR